MSDNRKPTHNAFAVTNPNRRQNEKPWFEKVGAAWPTQDGKGFFLKLFAIPVNGEIVVKEVTEDEPEDRQSYANQSRPR
jgi:hypothetical protein